MSFLKVAVFVVIDKADEKTVNEGFHKLIDGLVINHIPIFNSSLTSTQVEDVDNADEVRAEVLRSREDD